MRALLLTEYKRLEIATVPQPAIGPDVHGYDGHTGRRIPPLIMGHEAAGVVAEIGSNVNQFRPGDRVTFDSTVYCGKCFYCRRGDVNLCDDRNVLGVSCTDYRRHGAFAEFVSVPQRSVYPLPESLSFEQAAMVEPVSIAFHAVSRARMKLGDSVVVVGAGMMGQLVIQTLRLAGCGKLIAIDLDNRKLELARNFGADEAINADSPNLQTRVLELTEGRGTAVAFEIVGADAPFQTAVSSLRKGGALALVGNLSPKVELPLQRAVTREITLIGICGSCGEYPTSIDAMARGRIDVTSFLSACAPLEEGPMWFDRLYRQEPGLMKVILRP